MKTFSVNKNSWHYQLNIRMVKTNERLSRSDNAEKYVQSKDNLCSYWQMTLWSVFKMAVFVSFILALLTASVYVIYGYGYALLFHTSEALIGTAFLIGFVVALGLLFLGVTSLQKRKEIKMNKILYENETETSLTKAQYSSWKNGVCVPVEFKG